MIENPGPTSRQGLAPATNLTLVQHNSLGSWDVFLSLFSSLTGAPPALTLFFYKTPRPPKVFFLAFMALNLLPPPLLDPGWPVMFL